jgi:hypothetical protein
MQKKVILKLLFIFFSLNAFAEDVYDRINDCENQEDKNCVFKLLRELAAQTAQSENGSMGVLPSPDCLIGSTYHNNDILFNTWQYRKVNGAFTSSINRADIQNIKDRWKKLGCDSRTKVKCELTSDDKVKLYTSYGDIYFFIHRSLADFKNGTFKIKDVLNGLQESVCL